MTPVPPLPRSLCVVALLQLFMGVTSVALVVTAALQGRLSLDFYVLGIPICFGLLHRNRTWRTCCMTLLSIGLLFGTLFLLLALVGQLRDCIDFFGVEARTVPRVWIAIYAFPLLVLDSWQLRVLLRPDVTMLFVSGRDVSTSGAEASAG